MRRKRALLHGSLLVAGWGGFILLWLRAVADPVPLGPVLLIVLAVLAVAILLLTLWVAYAMSVALHRSPRLHEAVTVALYIRDRLGRPVNAPWPALKQLRCIAITVDTAGKHYQAGVGLPRERPPAPGNETGRG